MSKLSTVPMPLNFWAALQRRLRAEVQTQHRWLHAAAGPLTSTIISAPTDQARLEQAQARFAQGVDRLSALSLLALTVRTQLEACHHEIGAAALSARIQFVAELREFYAPLSQDRPPRTEAQRGLEQLQAAYNSASKAGAGEWAATERGRLLGQSVELPVFSAEDATAYEAMTRELTNDLTMLKTQLEAMCATTVIALEVTPQLTTVLQELGVGVRSTESVAEDAADAA